MWVGAVIIEAYHGFSHDSDHSSEDNAAENTTASGHAIHKRASGIATSKIQYLNLVFLKESALRFPIPIPHRYPTHPPPHTCPVPLTPYLPHHPTCTSPPDTCSVPLPCPHTHPVPSYLPHTPNHIPQTVDLKKEFYAAVRLLRSHMRTVLLNLRIYLELKLFGLEEKTWLYQHFALSVKFLLMFWYVGSQLQFVWKAIFKQASVQVCDGKYTIFMKSWRPKFTFSSQWIV